MSKLLIVDDQKYFLDLIQEWLLSEGFMVDCAATGPDALLQLKICEYDLIVLDINLPGLSGLDVCRNFRQRGGSTPIIFLTVNKTIDEKEIGFNAGADDYLTKPFHMRELSARIRAVLKRARKDLNGDVITSGAISINLSSHSVCVDGVSVDLQPKEFALLEFLMKNPDRVFSSDAILQRVWPSSTQASADTIRSHITRLRQKLGAAGSYVLTVHGIGYKFVAANDLSKRPLLRE